MALCYFPDEKNNKRLADYFSKVDNDDFFNGYFNSMDITRDPLITGYAFLKVIKLPVWVEYKPSAADKTGNGGSDVFRLSSMLEKNFRAFSGINDIELSTTSITEGFSNSENHFATASQRSQGFTTSHREYQGSPITNSIGLWVSSIRDPVTNVATYPSDIYKGRLYGKKSDSLIHDASGMVAYTAANHTGQFLYVSVRPDADMTTLNPSVIEKAILWTMVMPTKIPQSHYNYTAGSNDGVEIELNWTGVPIQNDRIKQYAVETLKAQKPYSFVHSGADHPKGSLDVDSNGTLSAWRNELEK